MRLAFFNIGLCTNLMLFTLACTKENGNTALENINRNKITSAKPVEAQSVPEQYLMPVHHGTQKYHTKGIIRFDYALKRQRHRLFH